MEKSIIEKSIITSLTQEELITLQNSFGDRIIVVKFRLNQCGPCIRINSLWKEWISIVPSNIVIVDINIDENINLYVQLKAKKMVNGVPAILAFYGDIMRDQWYIPDDSVSGGNEDNVKNFMDRCLIKAKTLIQ